MTLDDLKKLFMGPTLFRLDTILASRLVPVLYFVGLAAILIWAVDHLFFSFGFGWSNGLWGLLEIVVYGLLALVGLRIAAEMVLVFFKSHDMATRLVADDRIASTLLDEVRDAIHDLAEDEGPDEVIVPATQPPPVAPRLDESGDVPPRGATADRPGYVPPPAD